MSFSFRSTVLLGMFASCTAGAADLSRLQSLLDATPAGGWVKVNTNTLSSAFPTGLDAVPGLYGNPSTIVPAWSSFAWDSTRGDLLLWGGGHANYGGNEMYVWDSATGNWSLGSLPSRLNTSNTGLHVVGNGAPQSAHTYAGNVYLAANQRFMTFGGAAFPLGGNLQDSAGSTGPWIWDPAKADPTKVGGGDGTGWNPSRSGGDMWLNRTTVATVAPASAKPADFIHVAAASRVEGGKDVVYLTAGGYNNGFPYLYRYTVGDLAAGGGDTWEVVGNFAGGSSNGFGYQGVAAIDSVNNLFIRSGERDPNVYDGIPSEKVLMVWDLDNVSPTSRAVAKAVSLVKEDGTAFALDTYSAGIAFDPVSNALTLWSGKEDGLVYTTQATYGADGKLLSTWVVTAHASSTVAQPRVDTLRGTLGKWEYVDELGAFIGLEEYAAGDASVWLYKPMAAAVPEPASYAMLLLGLLALGSRRLRSGASGT